LAAIEGIYAEAERRKAVLSQLGVPNWTKLSKEDQVIHGFKPILVVMDEGTSLAKLTTIPKSLDKDDPRAVKIADRNSAKELIVMHAGNILRECRFVGIHVIFGTQRFGTNEIGQGAGEMRENMGARIILGRTSTSSLGMACADPQDAAVAYELAHDTATAEDDDPSLKGQEPTPGRGLAEIDGRGHVALQGAYAPVEELLARLEAMGIPRYEGTRRPVVPETETPFGVVASASTYSKPVEAPKVVDLDEIVLDHDDLDFDLDAAPEAPTVPELDRGNSFEAGTPAASASEDLGWDDSPAAAAPAAAVSHDDEDPFGGEPVVKARPAVRDDEDPFGEPTPVKPKPKLDDFEW
jgi:hypothetical protein